jgi:hypothetical protein
MINTWLHLNRPWIGRRHNPPRIANILSCCDTWRTLDVAPSMRTGGYALYQELPTGSLAATGTTAPTLKRIWHYTYILSIAWFACTITNFYGEPFSWQLSCTHPSCSTQQASRVTQFHTRSRQIYRCNLFKKKMTVNLSYTHIHKQEATLHDKMKIIEYNTWQFFHVYYMLNSWHAYTSSIRRNPERILQTNKLHEYVSVITNVNGNHIYTMTYHTYSSIFKKNRNL